MEKYWFIMVYDDFMMACFWLSILRHWVTGSDCVERSADDGS